MRGEARTKEEPPESQPSLSQVRSLYSTERSDVTARTVVPVMWRYPGEARPGSLSPLSPSSLSVLRKARQFYFGEEITEDDLKQFINLNTDVQFW